MTAPFLASGDSHDGRVPSWVWPLVPIALSGFFVSALTWFRLQNAVPSSDDAWPAGLVVALYQGFGFEATFMVSVLVLCWSSIWFFSGNIVRPWARLARIAALGLCLSILVSLNVDGTLTGSASVIGGFFAAKLSVVFGTTLTILLMVLVSLASLALATDFFFYRQFEGLAVRPQPRLQPRPEVVDEPGSGSIAGVERDAVFELESLRLVEASPRAAETELESSAAIDEGLARAVEEVVSEIERRDREQGEVAAHAPELAEVEAEAEEEDAFDDGVREIDLEDEPELADWAVDTATEMEVAAELVTAEETETDEDDEAEVYEDDVSEDDAEVELEAGTEEGDELEEDEVYEDDVCEDDAEVELEAETEGDDELEDDEVYEDDVCEDDAEVELEAGTEEDDELEDDEVYEDEPEVELEAGTEEDEVDEELDPEREELFEEVVVEVDEVASEATVEIPTVEPAASIDEDRSWVVPRPGAAQQSLFASAAADEELVAEAEALVVEYRRASVNFLKRRLRVGHDEAFELLQELAKRKIVDCEPGASSGRVIVESV